MTDINSINLRAANYFHLIYYTHNEVEYYSRLALSWESIITAQYTDGSLNTALTITALALVGIFCLSCCLMLFRKLYKTISASNQVFDQSQLPLRFGGRRRMYEIFPEQVERLERELDRRFPKQLFDQKLVEVGEPLCSICYEE